MAIVTAFDIAKQHYEAEIQQLTRDLEAARAERDRENLDHLEYVVAKTAQTDKLAHDLAEAKAENGELRFLYNSARLAVRSRACSFCDLEAARAERDLAIAHDRQPYPTAEAYEAVCAALDKHKHDLAELKAENDRLTSEDESLTQQLVNVLRHLAEAKAEIERMAASLRRMEPKLNSLKLVLDAKHRECDEWVQLLQDTRRENERLTEALREAEDALEFYADEDTYFHFDSGLPPNIEPDEYGNQARSWLKKHSEALAAKA